VGLAKKKLTLLTRPHVSEYLPRIRVRPLTRWIWKDAYDQVTINPNLETNAHINISGMSGFGKSTLCKNILWEIVKKLNLQVIVLDVHNEYVDYIHELGGGIYSPRKVSINLWELDGLSPAERIAENVEMLRRILNLGDIQAYGLLKCAEECYAENGIFQSDDRTWSKQAPEMRDIIKRVEKKLDNSKGQGKQSLASLSKRLYPLLLTNVFSARTTIPFCELIKKSSDFTLADLKNTEAQAVFIETFLRKLYNYMLSQNLTQEVKLYVLIDEAHKVCISNSNELSLPGRLVSEGRKYGIGIITSNQMARSLDRAIVANSAVTFGFYQKEPREVEYISSIISCGNDNFRKNAVISALRNLKQFEAIMITSKLRDPLIIKIEPIWERIKIGRYENFERISEIICEDANELKHGDYVTIISKKLKEKGIENKILNRNYTPDIEFEIAGEKVAVEYESGRKHDHKKIREMLMQRVQEYQKVLIVTPEDKIKLYRRICSSLNNSSKNIRILAFENIEKVNFSFYFFSESFCS
jgi:hypothetical protein